ncbi:Prefoldin subunit 1 [Fusarium acuminatum]|uniref:Prefoldin subunit 1 n=1 Tax=Fusarium acuminatum TaxID=5515 RepID=A0ABZ2WGH5_9HYPO
MSIPNEALQKLVREIESQALVAQQQIGLARTQMNSKQREQRLVKLTLSEMASLPQDAVVYEGVGKMYALPASPYYRHLVVTPQLSNERLQHLTVFAPPSQTQTLEGEVDKLSQRLLYLETTHKNSREHIEQMLRTK